MENHFNNWRFLFEESKSNGCTENIRKAKFWIGSLSDCVIEIMDGYNHPDLVEKRAKIQHDHDAYCKDPRNSSSFTVEHAYYSIAESPVNATIRKSKRCRKIKMPGQGNQERNDIIQKLKHANDSHLPLKVVNVQGKNRGVVTTERLSKGDFVVEYTGELIEHKTAEERENHYAMDVTKGCYMYYFMSKGKRYCIDATAEDGSLGRLVNHSKLNPNCITKVICAEKPRLVLIAKCDIEAGTEVLYDYGDRSKESLASFDWLKF